MLKSELDKHYALKNADETRQWLLDGWLEHIETGQSLDTILALKQSGFTAVSPRLQYMRKRRGSLLLGLWAEIQKQNNCSDWKASRILFSMIMNKQKIPAELLPEIVEIQLLNSRIGSFYKTASSLHTKLSSTYKQIAELLAGD